MAKAAGVSQSTTSRALSGAGYVAPAVRDRVRVAADQLGYVPHAMARSLRQQVSRSLGLAVSDLRNPFYADLAAGIAAQAGARGYTVMLVDDQSSAEDELSAARVVVSSRIAGVILTPVSGAVTSYLTSQQVPVVEVGRQLTVGSCDAVLTDEHGLARRLTEHLVTLGHRRIALLLDPSDGTTGGHHARGFGAALDAAGLPAIPDLLVEVGGDVGAARLAAAALLGRRNRPTALLAGSSIVAEGLWHALGDLGLQVPEDVSVVALEDAGWMSMVRPGVTAGSRDGAALGAVAVDRLLARLDDPDELPRTITLGAEILHRGSTHVPLHEVPGGESR
ncbi:MAG: LacI family DNA-binding transcriptional regulator [Friedmanniella sp.]